MPDNIHAPLCAPTDQLSKAGTTPLAEHAPNFQPYAQPGPSRMCLMHRFPEPHLQRMAAGPAPGAFVATGLAGGLSAQLPFELRALEVSSDDVFAQTSY